jgi:hypothetical protein
MVNIYIRPLENCIPTWRSYMATRIRSIILGKPSRSYL